jgi:hypothetical protein
MNIDIDEEVNTKVDDSSLDVMNKIVTNYKDFDKTKRDA